MTATQLLSSKHAKMQSRTMQGCKDAQGNWSIDLNKDRDIIEMNYRILARRERKMERKMEHARTCMVADLHKDRDIIEMHTRLIGFSHVKVQ